MGISILARAIPAAYGAALQNARKGGVEAAKSSEGVFTKKGMQLDEALMILNLEQSGVTPEAVQQVSSLWVVIIIKCEDDDVCYLNEVSYSD